MNRAIGILLPIFVISLFMLKGIMDIRRSNKGLEKEKDSKPKSIYWHFGRVEGYILLIWAIIMIAIFVMFVFLK